jgi:mucin-2
LAPATAVQAVPSAQHAASAAPQAGAAATPAYQPPLHGANPHGQGTIATVDLAPTDTRPLNGDPTGAGDTAPNREEIILGRARGDQRSDGTYHGHITILALFGNEILGVDTNQGQTHHGPLDPLQTAVLDALCKGSGGALCVNAVTADSSTTATGSTNHFEVAHAAVGTAGAGLVVDAANSNGNISSNGTCQTSHGDSSVANATLGVGVVAQAVQSSSDTKTCNNGTSTAPTATSKLIGLGGSGVPLPAAGCGNGTPNTDTGIPVLAPIVCNANDTATNQTSIPYNVREALTLFLLQTTPGDTAAAKITAGASESAAAAPPTGTTSTGSTSTSTSTGSTSTSTSTGSTSTSTSTGSTSTSTSTGSTSTGTTSSSTSTGSTGSTSTSTSTGSTSTGSTSTGTTSTSEGEPGETPSQPEEGTTGAGAATAAASNLPFTGYDVTGAVLLGLVLLGAGVGGRRILTRRARRSAS